MLSLYNVRSGNSLPGTQPIRVIPVADHTTVDPTAIPALQRPVANAWLETIAEYTYRLCREVANYTIAWHCDVQPVRETPTKRMGIQLSRQRLWHIGHIIWHKLVRHKNLWLWLRLWVPIWHRGAGGGAGAGQNTIARGAGLPAIRIARGAVIHDEREN